MTAGTSRAATQPASGAHAAERETRAERLTYWAFASMRWAGRTLPTHTGRMLFRWGGSLAYHLAPKARAVVAANQGQVLGRPADDPLVQASTKNAFRLYARYWYDAFDVTDWSDERIHEAMVFEGIEHMQDAIDAGTGAIAILPHLGNWDAAGRGLRERGFEIVAVNERLRPERLYRLFVEQREAVGMRIIGLSGDRVGKQVAAALAENNVLALLADRDLTGRGVWVEMFGARRRIPAGPAMLAVSTGAPIVHCAIYTTPTGWICRMSRVSIELTGDRRADITALSQEIARTFERAISAAPADWHVFQPAWDDDEG
ncbi:MAG: phosphatidylinositol mannoside acyltransferase [Actinomycetota bacterium]